MLQTKPSKLSKFLTIFVLIFAGEMIFSLPFHIVRVFRPTFLNVFELSNTELGDIFAVYGIMAMIAYFPGGTLADKFSPRKLMSISLFATAIGGLFLAQIPSGISLYFLFGYWGLTTIFLFWAAMIKSTREWGGNLSQGKAFGFLDGGRGLMAAVSASIAVYILSSILPNEMSSNSQEGKDALIMVIYFYSLLTFLSSILIWIFIKDSKSIKSKDNSLLLQHIKSVMKNPKVWLQALIVISAYVAYKGLDYFSLYSVDVLKVSEVESAYFMSYSSYIRLFSAVAAGFIVDKFSASKVILVLFSLLTISYSILSFFLPNPQTVFFIYGNIIVTFIAVFALRGVYFSLLEETKISGQLTGTAVGLISVIGYTPDAFLNSIAGRILDADPGAVGHQNFYLFLLGFAFIGLLSSFGLVYYKTNPAST